MIWYLGFLVGSIGTFGVLLLIFRMRLQEINRKRDISDRLYGEYQIALDDIRLHNSEESRAKALSIGRSYCAIRGEICKFLALPNMYTEERIQRDVYDTI